MKTFNYYYLTIFVPFFVFSCTHSSISERLVKAEHLLTTDQDSAYHMLSRMQAEVKHEPENVRMNYQLLLFRVQDLCRVFHHRDSSITKVAEYYKKRGDKVHLMQAYYCMGCLYRDNYDELRALNYYRKALDLMKNGRRYRFMGQTYCQMAHLELKIYFYKQALQLYKQACYYYNLVHDNFSVASCLMNIAYTYHIQNKDELALSYYESAYNRMNRLSNKSEMVNILMKKAEIYCKMHGYDSAQQQLDRVGLLTHLKCSRDAAVYYLVYGYICYNEYKLNSAIYYLKRFLSLNNGYTNERAYNMLSEIYKIKGDKQRALKYSNLYRKAMEQKYESIHDKDSVQLEAFYNYDRTEKEKENSVIAKDKRKGSTISLLLVLVFILSIGVLLYRYRSSRKVRQQRKIIDELDKQHKLNQKYIEYNSRLIEKAKCKISEQKDQLSVSKSDAEKWKLIALQRNEKKTVTSKQEQEEIWNYFRTSDIYIFFVKKVIVDGRLTCSYDDIKKYFIELKTTIDTLFNHFGDRLRLLYPQINETQMSICYLLKAEVRLSDMGVILCIAKQTVSSARARMKKHCFNDIKTLKTFDEFIHDF